ncbi:MAG: SpoVR family protein, partial [Bdellovibrionales bacterium]|nr:SpoVR family protein [Bdellovibrionales bacterium]
MSRPPQIIQFLAGRDVNAIAANGRLPVGHWHDGANILNANNRPGLIYEIVINGGNLRHSIYRDDVPLKRQFSILNHVAGHTHFGANTMWAQKSNAELNQAAYDFDFLMEELKRTHGIEAISEWYQYLLSLTYAQDLVLGDYSKPDDFITGQMNHPTANILQAFVANLPHDLPEWKIEMAQRFEQINRYIPGAIRTKIINEGFATLMQEVLPPHTGMNTFDHAMEYCCFVAGVIQPSISNPYWLGLEAWRNLRKNFNERPDIANLPLIEKDRAFIAYATNEIIGKMDDVEFLRAGLTESWIAKQNIALTRIAKDTEQDPNLAPNPNADPNKPEVQHIIITRDGSQVREGIIRQVFFSRSYEIPRPVLTEVSG